MSGPTTTNVATVVYTQNCGIDEELFKSLAANCEKFVIICSHAWTLFVFIHQLPVLRIMFILHINNICKVEHLLLFADDINILSRGESLEQLC